MSARIRARRVAGFFELLRDCCALDPGAVVGSAAYGPPYFDRFLEAWLEYQPGA